MEPKKALQFISDALQPQSAGNITRAGYVQIEQALVLLDQRNQHCDKLEKEVVDLKAQIAALNKKS